MANISMRRYLFSFRYEKSTQKSYLIKFLKEREIDFFESMQSIYADLYGTNTYYKLECVPVCDNVFEVYYVPEKTEERTGISRIYPLVEKAIKTEIPCYTVRVTFANNDSITTSLYGCRDKIESYYFSNVFNVGENNDNIQKAIKVEFLKEGKE